MAYRAQNPVGLLFYRGSSSGSFAIFTAIRRASSARQQLGVRPIPLIWLRRDFRYWHKADIATVLNDVSFWG
jgi:hypothetical protein